MDITALRAELDADPAGLGYAKHVTDGADYDLAKLLNAPVDGFTVTRPATLTDVAASLDVEEFAALPTDALARLSILVALNQPALVPAIFADGSPTREAFDARVSRLGTRAEQIALVPIGVLITPTDVALAFAKDRPSKVSNIAAVVETVNP